MLLRSSSTPILGSLLSSSSYFSESPSNNPLDKTHPPCSLDNPKKLSFSHGIPNTTHHPSSSSFHSFSCHFAPPPDSLDRDSPSVGGFRRARSDGNLEGLIPDNPEDLHRPHLAPPPIRTISRRLSSTLQTFPSLSIYNFTEEEEDLGEGEQKDGLERSVTIGGDFCFSAEEDDVGLGGNVGEIGVTPLFLARGLGIDVGDPVSGFMGGYGGGGGGGGGYPFPSSNGGDQSDMEAFYRKMVEENPCSALVLRNYAQFLCQTKGDLQGAEEYYSRAILAEPGDGEILSQYAKLIWQFHRDYEQASGYFEQAVQAAPQDSHVLGAYASFLWEVEDGPSEVTENNKSQEYGEASIAHGALASASA